MIVRKTYIYKGKKKKTRKWYVGYYIGGKLKWRGGYRTKKEAQVIEAKIKTEIAEGTYKKIHETDFSTWVKEWLDNWIVDTKPSTQRTYKSITKQLVAFFKNINLLSIKPFHIQKYKALKIKEGYTGGLHHHLTVLRKIFKDAIKAGHMVTNPATTIDKPKLKRREFKILTPTEIPVFLAHAKKEFYPIFATAVFTGLRRGELRALRCIDLDPQNNILHVERSARESIIDDCKSDSSKRVVMVPPHLMKILSKIKCEKDLLFTVKNKIIGETSLRNEFKRTLKRAHLRDMRFHDLRHTFAALLIHNKESIKLIQTVMGHASIRTTMDRYGHLLQSHFKDAGERMDKIFYHTKMIPRKNFFIDVINTNKPNPLRLAHLGKHKITSQNRTKSKKTKQKKGSVRIKFGPDKTKNNTKKEDYHE